MSSFIRESTKEFRLICALILYSVLLLDPKEASAFSAADSLYNSKLPDHCNSKAFGITRKSNKWILELSERSYTSSLVLKDFKGRISDSDVVELINSSPAGTEIIGSADISLDLNGTPLVLKPGTSIIGNGMQLTSSRILNRFIRNDGVNGKHVISGLKINSMGNDSYAVIALSEVNGVVIEKNTISQSGKSAIVVSSSGEHASKNIVIRGNHIHSPSSGVGHLILVKSLPHAKLVECVAVLSNRVVGADAVIDELRDYTPDNNFTGDQIVLQGVDGFVVSGNYSAWSGSSGFTVSRLSKNGVIDGNVAEMCFEPGFNLGSGFEEIKIDASSLKIGDILTNGSAELKISAFSEAKEENAILVRGQVSKDVFKKGDFVYLANNAMPKRVRYKVLELTRSLQNTLVASNTANSVAIQRKKGKTLAAYNTIRAAGMYFLSNLWLDSYGVGRADKYISLSASIGTVFKGDIKKYGRAKFQIAGPSAKLISAQ